MLQQKLKLLIKGEVVIIKGNNLCATITKKGPTLEVKHSWNDQEHYNFDTTVVLEKDQALFDFNPYSKLNVNAIIKRWGYFLGLAIERRAQGWTTIPLTQQENYKFELWYQPTLKVIVEAQQKEQARKMTTKKGY